MSNLIRSSRYTAGAISTVLALAVIALVLAAVLLSPPGTANAQASTDATLSALTVSPKGAIESAPFRFSYEVGLASTVTQATVTATATNSNATISYGTTGHQVDLSPGKNTVTVTITAQDGTTTQTYTVNINRGVTDNFGWKAADDLDSLKAAGNNSPRGIWSDETTIWVADTSDDKIYAYHKSDKTHDSSRDFNTLEPANNGIPSGIWSNGNTMWVADYDDDKIYAYRMSDKTRDASKDFNTLSTAGNNNPTGLWSDGATMWVADYSDGKIYAYRMSNKTRDASKDFDTLDAENIFARNCSDLWGSTGHQASHRGAAKHGICFASRLVPSNVNSYICTRHLVGRHHHVGGRDRLRKALRLPNVQQDARRQQGLQYAGRSGK